MPVKKTMVKNLQTGDLIIGRCEVRQVTRKILKYGTTWDVYIHGHPQPYQYDSTEVVYTIPV